MSGSLTPRALREELDRRPLVVATTGLIAGISHHWLGLFFLVAAVLICVRPGVRATALVAALVGLLLAPRPAPEFDRRIVIDTAGRVASIPRIYPHATAFVFESPQGRFLATAEGTIDVSYGDRLKLLGLARPPSASSRVLYANRGLNGRLRVTRMGTTAAGPALYRAADAWRRSFLGFAGQNLPERQAALASALTFNLDSLLEDDQTEAFRRGGTLHIVSASGAHVAMISAVLAWLLSRTPLPRGGQVGLLAAILAFYALTAGLQPPIVRAVLMGLALQSAYLWRREGDFASALAMAALVVLLWQPRALREVGFQLSFVTVGLMGLFGARSLARQALVASAASLPLVAYHFGEIPILSVPANILIATAVGVATIGGIAVHLLSLIWPAGAAFLMQNLIGPHVAFIEDASRAVGAPDWAVWRIPELPGWAVALVYAALIALWRPAPRQYAP